jgi:major histocompatibility complex class I
MGVLDLQGQEALRMLLEPGVVAHAFNPSTREAEAGGFLSSRPA